MKQKIINFFKTHYIGILSFFLPILIFSIACLVAKIFPFGNNYLAAYDGAVQYPGFTSYFIKVLHGKENLFYSFKGAFGFNFYATAIYYLFNPTNLLAIFFNESSIMEYYTFIIFLRIGLCGYTMSKFLTYKEKKGIWSIIFSVMYALISYNTVYFYNFMYFDSVIFLPLVILGLDKLIHTGKVKTYIIFLSLAVISNFYIGYMICIFSLLYFIYEYIILDKEKRNKKIIISFIISSLLAGLISAFVIIPEFFGLMDGKVVMYSEDYTNYKEFGMDFFTSFYRMSIGAYKNSDQVKGDPNIYSSILSLVLTVLFFFNKKFSKKEKICTGVFIAFFLLCFSFNLLDYAWQFFQRPIWYPNRYSFVFSFLIIAIAYKSFCNIDDLNIHPIISLFVIILLSVLISSAGIYREAYKDIGKLIFLILSIVCIIEYMLTIKNYKILIFILSVFFIEITANSISNLKAINYSKQRDKYNEEYYNYKEVFDYIENNETDKFYRAETLSWVNINNGGLYNYNGLLYFNSIRNGKVMTFLEDYAGYKVQDKCSTRFNMYNPILTSLFGLKYLVSENGEASYENIKDFNDDQIHLYKNDEALPLAFMVNSNLKSIELEKENGIENSFKILLESNTEYSNIYTKLSYDSLYKYWEQEDEDGKYVYYNSREGGYILFSGVIKEKSYFIINEKMREGNNIVLTINDTKYENFGGKYNSALLLNKGDEYELKFYLSSSKILSDDLNVYLLKYDEYINWINEMKNNQFEILEFKKDNYIKGNITVNDKKKTLLTTIPYDEGWIIFVDGKKIKYENLLTTFIGFDLEEGDHTIEFKYIPKGFITGVIISIMSLVGSIIYIKKKENI